MKKVVKRRKRVMRQSNVVLAAVFASLLVGCDEPAERAKVALPEPESSGAKLMGEYCANCHAPPLPTVHDAKEWPNVIYRMEKRRLSHALKPLSEEERATLLDYLKKHAKS